MDLETARTIVAAAAIEDGMSPGKIYSAPYQMAYPSPISTCGGGSWRNGTGTNAAKLENESPSEVGPYSMEKATALSVNTYFVQMIADWNGGVCIDIRKPWSEEDLKKKG